MAKNPNKYRFDLYVNRDNAMTIIDFAKRHSVSTNSLLNHLIVSFILNKDKFTFTFAADNNQQMTSNNVDDDTSDDDMDCFPEILKRIADGDDF